MQERLTYSQHLRAILRLGLPLIGSHIAQIAIVLTDAMMLGWYSVEALAAQVLAGETWFVLFIFLSGFAIAVMPMVASAQAAGEEVQVRRVTRMGFWASLLFGFAVMPVMIWSEPVFLALGQQPGTADLIGQYLRIAGWGILPALMVMVLKSFLAGQERTQIVLWVTVAAVGLNAVLNYALIFGNWGLPEMGIRGAAIASLVVNIAAFLALAVYAAKAMPEHALFQRFWRPDWEAFGQVFRLGWPIGITMLAESALFLASSVMMGWLGTVQLAAHGIAIQISSVTFMLHLGLSNAATIRAGQAYGRRDQQGLHDGARVVMICSAVLVALTTAVFLIVPEFLIGLFMSPTEPDRAGVIVVGVVFLALAALFQLTDAAQVVALGLLRGVHDTRAPMWIAMFSYWVIGVPASYLLGFTFGMGGVGIWLGLVIGLALAGALLMWRFWGRSGHWPNSARAGKVNVD